MFLKGFILGIIIMSIFTLISIIMIDNGKENIALIFAGSAMWIWLLIIQIAKKLKKTIKGSKYKSLIICPDGQIRYRSCFNTDEFIETHDGYSFAHFSEYSLNENWKIEDWDSKYICCGIGNVRYAPRVVWKRYERIKGE